MQVRKAGGEARVSGRSRFTVIAMAVAAAVAGAAPPAIAGVVEDHGDDVIVRLEADEDLFIIDGGTYAIFFSYAASGDVDKRIPLISRTDPASEACTKSYCDRDKIERIRVLGSAGANHIVFDAGDLPPVEIRAGGGDDEIEGNAKVTADLGSGDDYAHMGRGGGTIDGGAGNDNLRNEHTSLRLLGGAGDDTLAPGYRRERVRGGPGTDTLTYADRILEGVRLEIGATDPKRTEDIVDGVEIIIGSPKNDRLVGGPTNKSERFDGGMGDDLILGGKGADELTYSVDYSSGRDTFFGGDQRDTLINPDINGVRVSLDGRRNDGPFSRHNVHPDVEIVRGTRGADTLVGGPGMNYLYGLGGDDTLDGGPGSDVLDGDGRTDSELAVVTEPPAIDTATYATRTTKVQARPRPARSGPVTERDLLVGIERVVGGSAGDTILGFPQAVGGPGDDLLFATTLGSLLDGGAGADQVRGGPGPDRLAGGGGDDDLSGAGGDDELSGQSGADKLDGGLGADRLLGGYGVDALFGGPGSDLIDALDATAEAVDCGDDADTVRADAPDKLTGCETVESPGKGGGA